MVNAYLWGKDPAPIVQETGGGEHAATHRVVHNDVLLPTTFTNVTLARLKCKLPDNGRRPKHVGEILI